MYIHEYTGNAGDLYTKDTSRYYQTRISSGNIMHI
jgi:hypothetical protein